MSPSLRTTLMIALLQSPLVGAHALDGLEARLALRECTVSVRSAALLVCARALQLGLGPERAAVARRLMGRNLAAAGRFEEASAAYREAVRLAPGDADAHLALGGLLAFALDRPDLAEAELQEAARLAPADTQALLDLGMTLNALERHGQAVVEFRHALELDLNALDQRPAAQAAYLASLRESRWP